MQNQFTLPQTLLIKECNQRGHAVDKLLSTLNGSEALVVEQYAKQGCHYFFLVKFTNADFLPEGAILGNNILISSIYRHGKTQDWWVSITIEGKESFLNNTYRSPHKIVDLYRCPQRILSGSQNQSLSARLWRQECLLRDCI